jgi:ParB family chromosome partitioning protein
MLEIQYKSIDSLIPYANNARTHSPEQVQKIASSIKEFGFTSPILIDGDNGIIAGHGRLMASRLLNIDEVPTIQLDGLTDAQKRAYILADNRIALDSGWDNELLAIEFDALKELDFDFTLTGFEVSELTLPNINFEPATEDEQGKLDQLDPKWCVCPKCGSEFDLRSIE